MATASLRPTTQSPRPAAAQSSAAQRRLILRDTPAPSLQALFGPHWLADTLSDVSVPPRRPSRA